jgi:hypothetical protein
MCRSASVRRAFSLLFLTPAFSSISLRSGKLFDSKGQSWSYSLVLPRKHEILFRPRLIDQKRNSGSIMAKGAKNNLYNRFTREVTETAEGMRSIGAMDKEAHNLTPHDLSRGPRP